MSARLRHTAPAPPGGACSAWGAHQAWLATPQSKWPTAKRACARRGERRRSARPRLRLRATLWSSRGALAPARRAPAHNAPNPVSGDARRGAARHACVRRQKHRHMAEAASAGAGPRPARRRQRKQARDGAARPCKTTGAQAREGLQIVGESCSLAPVRARGVPGALRRRLAPPVNQYRSLSAAAVCEHAARAELTAAAALRPCSAAPPSAALACCAFFSERVSETAIATCGAPARHWR